MRIINLKRKNILKIAMLSVFTFIVIGFSTSFATLL